MTIKKSKEKKGKRPNSILIFHLSVQSVIFLFAASADSSVYVNVLIRIYNRSILWWSDTDTEHKQGSGRTLVFVVLPARVPAHVVVCSYFGFFLVVSVCVCVCDSVCFSEICVCVWSSSLGSAMCACGWMMWIDGCNPEQIKRALILATIT